MGGGASWRDIRGQFLEHGGAKGRRLSFVHCKPGHALDGITAESFEFLLNR
ncbi:hypothetical protein AMST5_00643 [freshwater sediment metagenome]|uniref:Uncharacterized protein n=1 Tax=freshwater sediment metagenome TaxID=556182 RepID=A0AA48M0P5_9ZZZZ